LAFDGQNRYCGEELTRPLAQGLAAIATICSLCFKRGLRNQMIQMS
jgi:hypothetical protein